MSYYKTEKPSLPAGTSIGCLATWIGTRGDYHESAEKAKALKGWRRFTNTHCKEARIMSAFVSFALIGSVLGYTVYRIKTEKQKQTKTV